MSCDDIIIEVPEEVIVIEMTPEGADGKDGNGIASIELISTVGLVKTYRITFTNGTHYDYEVEDGEDGAPGPAGNGIASISLISTSGLQKTYRITFTNGGHFDYVVTDGANGAPGADGVGIVSVYKTGTSGLVDTYTILYTNGNTDEFTVTNGAAGATGNGISSVEKIGTVGLVDTYRINFTNGSHYDYTVTNGQDGADPEWGNITGNIADQTDLQNALSEKADIIHTSASGSLVHITDAGAYPVDSLSVGIEPVQDLHGYDTPWPAGGGSNIWDEVAEIGGFDADGADNSRQDAIKSKNYIPCAQNTSYYIKQGNLADSAWSYFVFYDSSKNVIGSRTAVYGTFTTPSGSAFMRFQCNTSYGTTYNNNIAVNYPSTVTTYSPYSNVCPISGHSSAVVTRTGRNLCYDPTSGLFPPGDGQAIDSRQTKTAYARVQKNTSLVFSCNASSLERSSAYGFASQPAVGVIAHALTTQTVGSTIIFNSGNYEWVGVYHTTSTGTSPSGIQIEVGTIPSAYEPYQGTSVTVDLNGTRYGGTLNVLTGEMTVDRGIITFDGSNDESWFRSIGGTTYRYFIDISDAYSINGARSSIEMANEGFYASSGGAVGSLFFFGDSGRHNLYYVPPQTLTTVEDYKTWLASNPLQVVYHLATPLTVQLSANTLSLLLGENHIWADTGDTAVGYRADTKLYIDSKLSAAIAELQALILEH